MNKHNTRSFYLTIFCFLTITLISTNANAQPFSFVSLQNANAIDNFSATQDHFVFQHILTATLGQKWNLSPPFGCIKVIRSSANGRVLDVLNNLTANGTPIWQSSRVDGEKHQHWWIQWVKMVNGVDYFRLENQGGDDQFSRRCLSLGSTSPWPPVWLVLKDCRNTNDQLWLIVDYDTGQAAKPPCG